MTSTYYQERPYSFRIIQSDNVCIFYSFISFLHQPPTPGPQQLQLPWMIQHMQDLVSAFRNTHVLKGTRNSVKWSHHHTMGTTRDRECVCAVSAQLGCRRVSFFTYSQQADPPFIINIVNRVTVGGRHLPKADTALAFLRKKITFPQGNTGETWRKTGHVYQMEYQYYF